MPTARKHLPAPPLAVGTEADWYARTALAPESIAAATVLDLADPGTSRTSTYRLSWTS